ncbi:branched chain amino acid ABC transporter substrate-binding protein [Mycobacterium sp. ACS1612]|uniref:branched-chain amino acid ABC transporter substrate-binding protein n=1 Tax=Mycobacterium sp. ACS1612 TaxID=1834117 RepID=UPI0007FD13E5|nr:branched-chain amino acid ABC transporter substrate-binding protein [Mycobacterium sp. ACS1612]OBF25859.1 branched chain amino acid ABC transporter substrate-binding protein [Mycobacterium sp. ACS1612]
MRSRTARDAIALGSAALVALMTSACSQGAAQQAPPNLKIVGVTQIDANGASVTASSGDAPADPAGDGKAVCQPVTIATAGAFTGADAALGANMKDGVQLAVDRHNAANPGCQVQLKVFDTEDDPQKATEVAPQIIDDPSIVGLVGPQFSGETKATGSIFAQAGLVAVTPAATNVTLSQNGWKTFFRGLANDGVQGPSIANYLKNTVGAKKVCVIDDSTDYGLGIAQAVTQTLGPIAASDCKIEVKKGDKDFSAAVTQLKSAAPDAVFYGGYYTEMAQLVQQARDGGVKATFAGGDGSKDQQLVKLAGESSKDVILSCPCAPASGPFADDYTREFSQEPGTYSTEAYDLGTILVKGIDSGAITRQALLNYVRDYNGQGVARRYQWTPTGELTTSLVWIYKVQ